MKRHTLRALWIGGALMAAGLALALLGLGMSGFDWDWKWEAMQKRSETPTAEFRDIRISTTDSRVHILPSEDGRCRVLCSELSGQPYAVEVVDGALLIEQGDTRPWYERIVSFHWESPEVTVYLPGTAYGQLRVESVSGAVEVADGLRFSDAAVSSTSGSVRFDATVEQTLDVRTVSGAIRMNELCSGEVYVESTSGKLALTDVLARDRVSLTSVSGAVHLDRCDGEDIRITTTSGSVKAYLCSPKRDVTVTTTSGSRELPHSFGDHGACRIATTSGSVDLDWQENAIWSPDSVATGSDLHGFQGQRD